MKKFLAMILALTMTMGITACGSQNNDKNDKSDKTSVTSIEKIDYTVHEDAPLSVDKNKIKLDKGEKLYGAYIYTVDSSSGKARLIDYYGTETNLIVPNEIDGYTVGYRKWDLYDRIKDTVKTIDLRKSSFVNQEEFLNYPELEKVYLSEECEEIKDCAFDGCTSLTEIEIPKNVRSLGAAFLRGTSVKSVFVPKTVEFAINAFDSSNIESVELEDGLVEIDGGMFRSTLLKNVDIPESVETIFVTAFENCTQLEEVTIRNPKYIDIHPAVFKDCPALKKITIYSEDISLSLDFPTNGSDGEVSFNKSNNVVFYCKQGTKTETKLKEMGFTVENI